MKIVFDILGDFSVLPTDEKRIIEKFIDHETGYLIVEELRKDDPSDRAIYYTIIDPQTGQVIDIDTRLKQIDTTEKTFIDEESGLKVISQRTINLHTGLESINEKLIEVATGKEISSSKGVAFRPEPRETIIESYYEHKAREAQTQRFWREEYPLMSLEDRQNYWLSFIYRHMRTMGEMSYDQYNLFNKETYQEWKEKDADIDLILDYVIEKLPMAWHDDEVKQKINQMRGRDDEG